jgi:hypothetical protein
MTDLSNQRREKSAEHVSPVAKDFGQVANDLCEGALNEAKSQLHPLLSSVEVERLGKRSEFLDGFKSALERRIARKLVYWQPAIQAVFKFDEPWTENMESWDGSIHLLVKVPQLSNMVKIVGKALDKGLVKQFQHLGWSRFQKRQSILDVQQVTPNELRHGISYGAMFYAVYSTPIKVWPQKRRAE